MAHCKDSFPFPFPWRKQEEENIYKFICRIKETNDRRQLLSPDLKGQGKGDSVLAYWIPQTGWLKINVFSHNGWKPEVWDQRVSRLIPCESCEREICSRPLSSGANGCLHVSSHCLSSAHIQDPERVVAAGVVTWETTRGEERARHWHTRAQ